MTFGSFVKKTLTKACVIFAFITAAYAGLSMIVNVDDDQVKLIASRILLYFFASIFFALGNMILSSEKIGTGLRILMHYVIYLLSVYFFFMLPIKPEAAGVIIVLTLFSIVYAISLSIVLVVRSRYKTRSEKQQAYNPKFKK